MQRTDHNMDRSTMNQRDFALLGRHERFYDTIYGAIITKQEILDRYEEMNEEDPKKLFEMINMLYYRLSDMVTAYRVNRDINGLMVKDAKAILECGVNHSHYFEKGICRTCNKTPEAIIMESNPKASEASKDLLIDTIHEEEDLMPQQVEDALNYFSNSPPGTKWREEN